LVLLLIVLQTSRKCQCQSNETSVIVQSAKHMVIMIYIMRVRTNCHGNRIWYFWTIL